MDHPIGSKFASRLAQIKKLDPKVWPGLVEPLFYELLESISEDEKILFNTAFSRIAYVGTKYNLKSNVLYGLHTLRKSIRNGSLLKADTWSLVFWSLGDLLERVYSIKSQYAYTPNIARSFKSRKPKYNSFISKKKVNLLSLSEDLQLGVVVAYEDPHTDVQIVCDELDLNENFTPNLKALVKYDLLPIEIMLHNIRVDQENKWHPQLFVFEPDYLIDVTSIAECFQPFGLFSESYLLRKFLPQTETQPLLIGVIVNYFLDQLLLNTECTFEELFPKTFKIKSFSLALLEDDEVIALQEKCRVHFDNLKEVVNEIFPQEGIDVNKVMLEPSFYSPSYGLQGRLDVLSIKKTSSHIIELKSGKPFRPNAYGLSSSHFIQTLLYDVIIKNLSRFENNPTCYILYSRLSEKALRHAPFVFSKLTEALVARNILILYERIITTGKLSFLLSSIQVKRFGYVKGFSHAHVVQFEKNYSELTHLSKSYFLAFCKFLAAEQRYSKLGKELSEINGLSSLWRDTLDQKIRSYAIINQLTFDRIDTSEYIIELRISKKTNRLSNFRVGDIVVLYADEDGHEDVLESHVLKGTLTALSPEKINIRLRSIPMDASNFENTKYWNVEHDLIDSQFNKMYQSLYKFVSSPADHLDLYLGLRAPRKSDNAPEYSFDSGDISDEQRKILKRIVTAKDYFLLWGPPGTGKTSVIMTKYVEHLINNTDETVLIMAYTNRAVDEICQCICQFENVDFIRIGSRYSVAPQFKDSLLSANMENIHTRSGTRSLLNKTRVFVATASSLLGVPQLFKLKFFDRVIIDEASQLLEPQIVGILSNFNRVLFIGDHLQLPAVSQSDQNDCRVDDPLLLDAGISKLNISLFERLLARCQKMNWKHAYDMLSFQGRMHDDINYFPSSRFYNGRMKILRHNPNIEERLTSKWCHDSEKNACSQRAILSNRCIFYDTGDTIYDGTKKHNIREAKRVTSILNDLKNTILKSHTYSVGVITPYRAQIATIRDKVGDGEFVIDDLTIDTVERYQGGARDIIIISLCINHPRQLYMLQSLTEYGVDRKFNVMLTRAREQIIVLGNKDILINSPHYRDYIKLYEQPWTE